MSHPSVLRSRTHVPPRARELRLALQRGKKKRAPAALYSSSRSHQPIGGWGGSFPCLSQ
jgi:hypothetical protein